MMRRSAMPAFLNIGIVSLTSMLLSALLLAANKAYVEYLKIEEAPTVVAFLKDEVNETEALKLTSQLSADARIRSIRYVSKSEALKESQKMFEQYPEILSNLASSNPLPASVEISLKAESLKAPTIVEIANKMTSLKEVEDVKYDSKVSVLVQNIRSLSMAVAGAFGGGCALIVILSSAFWSAFRKNEGGYPRAGAFFVAAFMGALGGIIGVGGCYGIYYALSLEIDVGNFLNSWQVYALCGTMGILGAVGGAIGSFGRSQQTNKLPIITAILLLAAHTAYPAPPPANPNPTGPPKVAKNLDKKFQAIAQVYLTEVRKDPTNLQHHLQLIEGAKANQSLKVAIQIYEEAIERNPNSPLVRFLLGYSYMTAGGATYIQKAIGELKRASSLQPNFPEALMALADCYLIQAKKELAVKKWKEAVQGDKNFLQPHLKLAQFYKEEGDYENAVVFYELALKINPALIEIRLELAELHFEDFNYSAASAEFMTSLKYDKSQAMTYYRLSQIAALRGDFDAALDMCQNGLRLDPTEVKFACELVCNLLDNSKQTEAIKLLQKSLLANPQYSSFGLELAELAKSNEPETTNSHSSYNSKIISVISKAVAKSKAPDSAELRKVLARLYLINSDRDSAIVQLQRVRIFAPEDPDVYYMLGSIYESENPQKAFEEYQKAHSGGSRNSIMLIKLANFHLQRGNSDRFIDVARVVAKIGVDNFEIYLSLAQALNDKAKNRANANYPRESKDQLLKEAALYAERSLEFVPLEEATRCYLTFAQIYADQGKLKAMQLYDKALKLSPKDAEIYCKRAAFMLNFKVEPRNVYLFKAEEAIADLKIALQNDPNLAEAHYWLGVAYQRVGKNQLAAEEFQRAKSLSSQKINENGRY